MVTKIGAPMGHGEVNFILEDGPVVPWKGTVEKDELPGSRITSSQALGIQTMCLYHWSMKIG